MLNIVATSVDLEGVFALACLALVVGSVHRDLGLAEDVHPVIIPSAENRTADNIPQRGWNDALPNVHADGQARCLQPDTHGDQEHVRYNVIETQTDKGKDWPPHADDLGTEVLGLHAKVTRETDKPVTPDTPEEDLVESRLDLLRRHQEDHLVFVHSMVEDTTIWRIVSVIPPSPAAVCIGQLYLHPNITAITNSDPARLPQKQRNQ